MRFEIIMVPINLTTIAFLAVLPSVLVYGIYGLVCILHRDEDYDRDTHRKPVPITVVIPARNEEGIIKERIKNLSVINYPDELIEVLVIDDASVDKTSEKACEAMEKYKLKGRVLGNEKPRGTNYSFNKGIKEAVNEIVVTTDADVIFEKDAIRNALDMLLSDDRIGAVSGELIPGIDKKTISTSTEIPYRDVYGKICSWESKIGSTYCFNGPLIILRRKAYTPIDNKRGATDASAALSILRNGYKTLYLSSAQFIEPITIKVKEQKKQKIRRATRLLQCTWDYKSLLFRRNGFGSIVYPLRFIMFFFIPPTFFLSMALWSIVFTSINPFLGLMFISLVFLFVVIGKIKTNILSSFIWHQYYLLQGLLNFFRDMHQWESIERKVVK